MNTPAVVQAKVPGAMLALFAFMLTVLLGIGGTSAVALWQQSASATMSVSAAASWPGSGMGLQCASGPGDSVTLTITNAPSPTSVSVASRTAGGTYGSEYTVTPTSATIVVAATSFGIPASVGSTKNGKIDLRVSAWFDGGSGMAEISGLQLTGNNSKLACQ
ncbi:hypothetical protein [Arthrobacter sp. NPDC056727]|uniref:hypothetical protein n=1 Tax=Arthrobacter sp. NPDC056727 TaxID=3345927 RepID=UPI00366EC119